MNNRGFFSKHIWQLFLLLFLVAGFSRVSAQFGDELEGLGAKPDTVKCKPDTMLTIYDQSVQESIDPQQLGIWYSLASEEFKYKNYKRAIPYYWKIVLHDTTGKFKVAYAKLAESYYNLKEPDSVLIAVYRGLDKYPTYTTLHYWGGFTQDLLGHSRCAVPHYQALTEASPDEKSYWVKLAYLLYKQDDVAALDAQQKVVELDPDDAEAAQLLPEMMKHFDVDPIEAYRSSYEQDTTNAETAWKYAKVLFERGEYEKALPPFKTVVKNEPTNTTALEYLGQTYESLGQLSKALEYYKRILEQEPDNAKVMSLMASIYGRQNNFTTARNYVIKAQRVDPNSG
ncbi:MAG: tetratricopeptide repeat protein, partial [Calditrichia bacterium]